MKDLFQINEITVKPKKIKGSDNNWVKEVLEKFNLEGNYKLSFKDNKIRIDCGNYFIIGDENYYYQYLNRPPLHKNPLKTVRK
jgi:hypothetical protein